MPLPHQDTSHLTQRIRALQTQNAHLTEQIRSSDTIQTETPSRLQSVLSAIPKIIEASNHSRPAKSAVTAPQTATSVRSPSLQALNTETEPKAPSLLSTAITTLPEIIRATQSSGSDQTPSKELNETREKLRVQSREIVQLRHQLQDQQAEIESARIQVERSKKHSASSSEFSHPSMESDHLNRLQQQIHAGQNRAQHLQQISDRLQKSLEQEEKNATLLKDSNQNLTSDLDRIKQNLNRSEQQLAQLKDDQFQLGLEYESNIQRAALSHDSQMQKVTQELLEERKKHASTQNALSQIQPKSERQKGGSDLRENEISEKDKRISQLETELRTQRQREAGKDQSRKSKKDLSQSIEESEKQLMALRTQRDQEKASSSGHLKPESLTVQSSATDRKEAQSQPGQRPNSGSLQSPPLPINSSQAQVMPNEGQSASAVSSNSPSVPLRTIPSGSNDLKPRVQESQNQSLSIEVQNLRASLNQASHDLSEARQKVEETGKIHEESAQTESAERKRERNHLSAAQTYPFVARLGKFNPRIEAAQSKRNQQPLQNFIPIVQQINRSTQQLDQLSQQQNHVSGRLAQLSSHERSPSLSQAIQDVSTDLEQNTRTAQNLILQTEHEIARDLPLTPRQLQAHPNLVPLQSHLREAQRDLEASIPLQHPAREHDEKDEEKSQPPVPIIHPNSVDSDPENLRQRLSEQINKIRTDLSVIQRLASRPLDTDSIQIVVDRLERIRVAILLRNPFQNRRSSSQLHSLARVVNAINQWEEEGQPYVKTEYRGCGTVACESGNCFQTRILNPQFFDLYRSIQQTLDPFLDLNHP